MKMLSAAALGIALLVGGAASAQEGAGFSLSKSERAGLAPLVEANRAGNHAAAQAALPAARSAAASAEARYLVAGEALRLAIATDNRPLQAEAIDAILATGLAPAAELPDLLRNQASLAFSAGKREKGEDALKRLLQAQPNDINALETLTRMRVEERDYAAAAAMADRAVEAYRAAGRPVAESLYKYGLNYATMSRLAPQAMKFALGLAAAYPSAENWRDVLLTYRDMLQPDPATQVDIWRLLRATGAMAGERDYFAAAELLNGAGHATEAKAVLEEGIAANMVSASDPQAAQLRKSLTAKAAQETKGLAAKESAALAAPSGADALALADVEFGQGDYAKAASLYAAALQKGSVDADLANSRLGMALVLAGRKAEALPVLQAVSGPRAQLAAFLLAWAQRHA